jgi:hypothetical protein
MMRSTLSWILQLQIQTEVKLLETTGKGKVIGTDV